MKLIKHILIVTFCMIIITSCFNEESIKKVEIKSFPLSIELKSKEINTIQAIDIHGLRIVDTLLIINSSDKNNGYFINYFSSENFRRLGGYGKKGRGPGEFLSATFIPNYNEKNNKTISIYDHTRRRINYVDLEKSIKTSSYTCKSKRLPNNLSSVGVIFENDTLICTIIGSKGDDSRVGIYNKKNGTTIHIPYIPKIINGHIPNKNNRYILYATVGYCVSHKSKRLIIAPFGNKQLDFFDFSGNYIKTIHLADNARLDALMSTKNVMTDVNGFNGFISDLRIINDELFAMFITLSYPKAKVSEKSRIYVFDLNGKPKREYILNESISLFAIDTINNRFVGFEEFSGEKPQRLLYFNY